MGSVARLFLFCGLVAGLATSCQTTQRTVSIDRAKEITAKFDDRTFTAPPRKVEDIHRLLEVASDQNKDELMALQARAEAKAPIGSTPAERAESLRDRAMAAAELGHIQQMITDLEAAWAQGLKKSKLLSEIFYSLGHAEAHNGNLRKAADYRLKALRALPATKKQIMRRHSRYAGLAYARAKTGDIQGALSDLETARRALEEARAHANRLAARGRTQPLEALPIHEALMAHTEGGIAEELGQYERAEKVLRHGLRIIDADIAAGKIKDKRLSLYTMGTTRKLVKGKILERLSRVLSRTGRYAEAEVFARDAIALSVARFGRNSVYTASALETLISVLGRTARTEEARALAQVAVDIYLALRVEAGGFTLNKARKKLAGARVASGDWQDALNIYDQIGRAVSDDILLERLYRYDLNRAIALLHLDRVDDAVDVTGPAVERLKAKLGAKHFDTAEALGLHGVALQRQGKTGEALVAFRQAFPILTKRSRQTDSGGDNIGVNQRLQFILEGYLDALSGAGEPASIEEAFVVANTARSNGVQEALARSAARASIDDPVLKDLVRREQDAQHQIKAYYGLLSNALQADGTAGNEITATRKKLDDLRGARAALMGEIENRFPDYARLINPKPATVASVQNALAEGESLVAAYVAADKTYLWAIPKSGAVSFAAARMGRRDIAGIVKRLRRSLDPQATTLGDIPAFDVSLSHRLYETLLDPVRPGWQAARSLLIVANGALPQLPFSTLVTEPTDLGPENGALFSNYKRVSWLARSHGVTVLPSVTSLMSLRSLPKANGKRRNFIGFGDPYFNAAQAESGEKTTRRKTAALSSRGVLKVRGMPVSLRAAPKTGGLDSAGLTVLPRLPDTFEEVHSIADALHADSNRDVYTGARASEYNVKSIGLSTYRVVAFATHGLVPGDLDGLSQPALALASPLVSGHADQDGLLTMGEVLGLKLDADWVVLSACNTGAGDGAGAEAFSGLGRAFFYAGTRALLLSNWPVETTSARALTTDIFRRQADDPSLGRAEAMRRAMLNLIDGKGYVDESNDTILFSYAHPIFWAPFSLVGDGA